MPPPTTPGQPPPPTTTTPEMAAAALLTTITLSRIDITTITTITLPRDKQPPPTGPGPTSSTTSAETSAAPTPEPIQTIDNIRFGIPPRVGTKVTNGTNDSGPVLRPVPVLVLAPRDDGAVVCERRFGVTGACPVSLTVVAMLVLTVTKDIIAVCIIGVVLLFCVAGPCWEAIGRWRERRRKRGEEAEVEVQQGLGTGAEGGGARGGGLG